MIADPAFYAVAVTALLIVGISKGGFGGGLAVVAVPLMSLTVAPPLAAAISLPILCAMDLYGLWTYRGRWDATLLRILLPAGALGILLGTLSFRHLDADAVKLIVGTIAVAFAVRALRKAGTAAAARKGSGAGWFWGGLSGFTSFVAHAGGPPLTAYLVSRGLPKTTFVATSVLFFGLANYVKLVPYAWLGQLTADTLLVSLALAPVAPAGVALGAWLHRRLDDALFYRLVNLMLLATGAKLVADAAGGYW